MYWGYSWGYQGYHQTPQYPQFISFILLGTLASYLLIGIMGVLGAAHGAARIRRKGVSVYSPTGVGCILHISNNRIHHCARKGFTMASKFRFSSESNGMGARNRSAEQIERNAANKARRDRDPRNKTGKRIDRTVIDTIDANGGEVGTTCRIDFIDAQGSIYSGVFAKVAEGFVDCSLHDYADGFSERRMASENPNPVSELVFEVVHPEPEGDDTEGEGDDTE